jgi:hypothetical protein
MLPVVPQGPAGVDSSAVVHPKVQPARSPAGVDSKAVVHPKVQPARSPVALRALPRAPWARTPSLTARHVVLSGCATFRGWLAVVDEPMIGERRRSERRGSSLSFNHVPPILLSLTSSPIFSTHLTTNRGLVFVRAG